jgi:hypothetical protein
MKEEEKLLNEQQWNLLKQAAPHFETARHEYLRNCPRWLSEQVINVYEAATGKTILHKDLSCAVCVLRIFQTVSKLYFYNLEERNKLELEDGDKGNKTKERDAKPKARNKKKKE